jgi:hypothetical protein
LSSRGGPQQRKAESSQREATSLLHSCKAHRFAAIPPRIHFGSRLARLVGMTTREYTAEILLDCTKDAHGALVGVAHGVIHERVAPRMMHPKFEDSPVTGSYLKALDIMQGIGRITTSVDCAKDCPNHVKIRKEVGPDVDEKHAYQLTNLDRNWMAP